ncbi:antitoxin [Spirillospora albida]|uniref:antitoxin n=1 Tax=Spirillospora albida TaxID=58123 RepID=UPI001FE05C92|nr:antitoxin [Spirillospora albida]
MEKVKHMFGQHPDQARQGVERAGDMFDQRTGGKHADRVDQAQRRAGDAIDRGDEGRRPGGEMPGRNAPH